MEDKLHLNYTQVEQLVQSIIRDIEQDTWRPDYIVGLTRGGLLPATLLSQYLSTTMYSLDISLRDANPDSMGPTSNCWMPEDALDQKKILIVEDINDSGATLNWLIDDWKTSCRPDSPEWEKAIGGNVRIATLVNKASSKFKNVTYTGMAIDENAPWVIFPWEEWWTVKSEE